MKRRRYLGTVLALAAMAVAIFAGCGDEQGAPKKEAVAKLDLSTAKDGTYSAVSSSDQHLGTGQITIVIKDHQIAAADFIGITPDGELKDTTYGMADGVVQEEAKYKKAQIAVKANNAYAAQLIEAQDPQKVDAITGATVSYNQFQETAEAAIAEAKK